MMQIGVLVSLNEKTDIKEELQKVKNLQLSCCQLCCWNSSLYTPENAVRIRAASAKSGIPITALWAGWNGPAEWNFTGGPATLGLIPAAYRFSRLKELFAASDFAALLGVTDVITHVGFLPENPQDPTFTDIVTALRSLSVYMKEKKQYFLFETGQETPVTMLRTIEAIGTDNLGINFDTANLLLYGKANPADALDIFGKYVRNTHCKDGEYPTCGTLLGEEKPLGQGRANLPLIVQKLSKLGYQGPLTIEREIEGEEQIHDIEKARDLLNSIVSSLFADCQ